MSHCVAYILQFQEIIVYKIPPGGGGGSIASLRSKEFFPYFDTAAILISETAVDWLSQQPPLAWWTCQYRKGKTILFQRA